MKKNGSYIKLIAILMMVLASISGVAFFAFYFSGRYQYTGITHPYIVIQHANYWDGTDSLPQYAASIVIESNKIRCIGDTCSLPDNAYIIEAEDQWVMPAFIDINTSFFSMDSTMSTLPAWKQIMAYTKLRPRLRRSYHESGITTLQSRLDPLNNIELVQSQVQEGKIGGPRILISDSTTQAILETDSKEILVNGLEGRPSLIIYTGKDTLSEFILSQIKTQGAAISFSSVPDNQLELENYLENIQRAYLYGIPLCNGMNPIFQEVKHKAFLREILLMARSSVPTSYILQAVTLIPAGLLKIDHELGKIQPGFQADILLLSANPLQDIQALTKPLTVLQAGNILFETNTPTQ